MRSFAYFARTSCSFGWASCMRREDRIWLMVGFTITAFSVHVNRTMDRIQVMPQSGFMTRLSSQCHAHITAEIGQ